MAVEAHRLISMSLGKIAASRGQRGGASLHKNLLVSTVLYKARTAFMMENFQAMVAAKKAREVDATNPLSEPPRPATPAPAILSVPNPAQGRPEETTTLCKNKENTPPSGAEQQQNKGMAAISDNSTMNTENASPSDKENSCAKCLKRRFSDAQVQPGSDSQETLSPLRERECVPNKRAKCDSNIESDSQNTQQDTSSNGPEPMQTESVQITNLVTRFNSGLSGLLGNSGSNGDNLNGQSPCDSFVSSCATQVATFSESLGSRPVIALTV